MKAFNKIQRIIALILVLVMALSVFASCMPMGNGGNSDDEQNNTGNNGTSDNGNKPEDNPDKNPDDIPDDPTDEPTDEPHNCAFGEWVVVKQPTNTDEGIQERKCECGKVEQKAIPASGGEFAIYYNNLKTAEYPAQTGFNSSEGLLSLPTPVANGYKFIGWFTASIGGEIVDYIPKGSTKDFVLFAHWELVTYDITYKNVPDNVNPTSYTIETKLKLTTPKWSGLEFDYWSDDNGNKYYPDVNVTAFPEGMYGDLVLTANWKVLRNIATPVVGDGLNAVFMEDGKICFIFELGTIEHVVLDNIHPDMYYKYEGIPLNLSLSKTVLVGEETAESTAKTISKSVSSTSSFSSASNWATENSLTSKADVSLSASAGWGPLSMGIETTIGVSATDTTSYGHTTSRESSSSSSSQTSTTVSSSLTYKKEMTSEITENLVVDASLPSGYYAYVHAGNIRVYGIVTYDIETGIYYIDTYSVLDNMHSMMMYYADVNQLNNPTVGGLDFNLPEETIRNYMDGLYYVRYDANGGSGTMADTVHTKGGNECLAPNAFTKKGMLFAGWELQTENGTVVLQDGQSVTNLGKSCEVVVLKAIWAVDPEIDVVYTLTTKSGTISNNPKLTYKAEIQYRNRTADSVEMRIVWTSTIAGGTSYTVYGQKFNFSCGSAKSGNVKVVSAGTWKNASSSSRSETAESGWVKISLNTKEATQLSLSVYCWQINYNDLDMNKYDGTECVKTTWKVDIPACRY